MKWRAVIAWVLLGLLCSPANAQTTQPAAAAWADTVQRFSTSLADPDGADDSKNALSEDCAIRSFKEPDSTLATLAAHTSGATVLLAKAYTAPVTTLAADIAAAIDASTNVPESIKKIFVPADSETAKADSVAWRWVSRALNLSDGQSAGVLIYITGDPAHPDTNPPQPLFVLLKGQADSAGDYHITQIVFGDPQQAVAAAR